MRQIYIYAADLWCRRCGKVIVERLTAEGKAPPPDSDIDSDDFPVVGDIFDTSDYVTFCAAGANCLDPIILPDGEKIGDWLGQDLTDFGIRSLVESALNAPSFVVRLSLRLHDDQIDDFLRNLTKPVRNVHV